MSSGVTLVPSPVCPDTLAPVPVAAPLDSSTFFLAFVYSLTRAVASLPARRRSVGHRSSGTLMMAEKTSKTLSTGTPCRRATSSNGNRSWHVSATSTIRFGDDFRYVGWISDAGGFTGFVAAPVVVFVPAAEEVFVLPEPGLGLCFSCVSAAMPLKVGVGAALPAFSTICRDGVLVVWLTV